MKNERKRFDKFKKQTISLGGSEMDKKIELLEKVSRQNEEIKKSLQQFSTILLNIWCSKVADEWKKNKGKIGKAMAIICLGSICILDVLLVIDSFRDLKRIILESKMADLEEGTEEEEEKDEQ